ncbi:MAG: hemolysin family protein [Candidatus Aminicenantes bacterium]|nr:hemolysin family protein [Candidatus Aminicenantes bacterium]
MFVFYMVIIFVLVLFSAFFSSAETSLLTMNKIKLNLKANKNDKKALLLTRIIGNPDEFFSAILIGNNLTNIAAASFSTILFSRLFVGSENLVFITSTLFTTVIVLVLGEIIPKSYAFRRHEKLSYLYAYPIKFFMILFYPFVKVLSALSALIFKKKGGYIDKKELTNEEIKHFLSSEIKLFHYHPDSLRMINEIIDTAGKDVKSLMTPRLNIIAVEENAGIEELKRIILEKRVSKIPIYKDSLDNITGIIKPKNLSAALMSRELKDIELKTIASRPIFISEYSPLNFVVKEFKKRDLDMAVILDEYGSTIGILTINDIFSEILGGIRIAERAIKPVNKNTYIIRGSISVEEVNAQLDIDLPEKKDYTTVSGMFVYHFGRLPGVKCKLKIKNYHLSVEKMGKRKIEEVKLILSEIPGE